MARHLERGGDREPDVVVHRAVDVDGELAGAFVEVRHGAGGLDRLAAGTRPAQPAFDHTGGAGKRLLDRTEGVVAVLGDVVRSALGMKNGVAAQIDRVEHVGHRRQNIVVDFDEPDRVLGEVARIRHDQRHRLADMADLADGDAALLDRRIGEAGQRPGFLGRILPGDHGDDAGQRQRRALVDRLDSRVRVRASQHRGVSHVRQADIVDETAAADQEARVFLAQHARADDLEPLVRPFMLTARVAAYRFFRPAPSAASLFRRATIRRRARRN